MRWLTLILLTLLINPAHGITLSQQSQDIGLTFFPSATHFSELSGNPPVAAAYRQQELLGLLFFTEHLAAIPAYSGKPINLLIGLDLQGQIRGVQIVEHQEPVLVLGINEDTLALHTQQYQGLNSQDKIKVGVKNKPGQAGVDALSGATITSMVMNATITTAIKKVAAAYQLPQTNINLGDIDQLANINQLLKVEAKTPLSNNPNLATDLAAVEVIWLQTWQEKQLQIVILIAGLIVLTIILFLQDWLTRYPILINRIRVLFLIYTLVFIGWYGLAQLSVINVLTFASAVMNQFRWEFFLIDPLMFILWGFVAMTLLLWGRGVYCGWLCPFGALQELINKVGQKLRVSQWQIPELIHERLLAIKYIVLIALFGLSLHSMADAARLAEIEPFKTSINMHFMRAWPFLLYAGTLLLISLFNGKFFCKYLCPLGAALTIPSHFRIFDWLKRRKECGRPCQTCAVQCPSQAIRPTGEINANECHHCLDCQITYWDDHKCPPLVEKRKRREKFSSPSSN